MILFNQKNLAQNTMMKNILPIKMEKHSIDQMDLLIIGDIVIQKVNG